MTPEQRAFDAAFTARIAAAVDEAERERLSMDQWSYRKGLGFELDAKSESSRVDAIRAKMTVAELAQDDKLLVEIDESERDFWAWHKLRVQREDWLRRVEYQQKRERR
jgi:hypothetical protein